jgi:drug/metabolite transporter (DMT)-like permease
MATFRSQRYIPAMKSPRLSTRVATLLIVASAVSFGSISVLTVLVTGAGVPLITAMAWRYILACMVLVAVVGTRSLRSFSRRRVAMLVLIGGFGQALITYLSLRALDYIPVGPLAFLFYTYPAWVALVAAIRGTESLTVTRILALTLALAGVAVMVGAPINERLNPLGVTLALFSAVLYSMYLPSLEHLQQGIPAGVSTLILVAGAATFFTIAAFFRGELYVPIGRSVWANILLLAIVSTVIAFFTLIKGLDVLGPVRTSIIATVEPFFTALLGASVLGNQLTPTTLLGGVFIASAVVLIQWTTARLTPTTA